MSTFFEKWCQFFYNKIQKTLKNNQTSIIVLKFAKDER